MTFQPVVPFSGIAGWRFLERTMDTQKAAYEASATVERDLTYFSENIGKIKTAEALVSDRRILSVALGAFGLDDDINNRFFIRKVLEDGTLNSDALGNRLADKSYLKMAKAFGFGDFDTPNTVLSDFPEKIISAYKARQFEIAVGESNSDMRLALNLEREMQDIAASDSSDDTKWFTIMGSEPLREVFEVAFGLPSSFASLDLDQQLGIFRDKAARTFGDGEISQFSDPEKMDDLIRRFLVRSELNSTFGSYSPASTALTLLQNAGY